MHNVLTKSLKIVFLLGAGFNVDAASEAGNPKSPERLIRYPLVCELLDVCFGMDVLPTDKSIEDLFQDCIDKGRKEPLNALYQCLMEADYFITPHLTRGGDFENNIYLKFLKDFSTAPLITFNYDSLPEILLLGERLWRPEEGYGVSVQANQRPIKDKGLFVDKSRRSVLHLHGSLCVYPATFEVQPRPKPEDDILQLKPKPDFFFDPDNLGRCFFPYDRIYPDGNYTPVIDRVIAPIPDKSKGLHGEFIKAIYMQATEFVSAADQIVVIGYSFNPNDRASYAQLLTKATGKIVLLISRNAGSLTHRLSSEHPDIQWKAESLSFKEWVNSGYTGLQVKE